MVDSKKAIKLIQDLDLDKENLRELAEEIPWIKYVAKTYEFVRIKRLIFFLKGLEKLIAKDSKDANEKLQKHLKTKYAQDYLSDYIDKVILNSSETIKTSLAILYCEQNNEAITEEMATQIIIAIHGMTEREVKVFLQLYESMKDAMENNTMLKKPEEGFSVFQGSNGFIVRVLKELTTIKLTRAELLSYHQDFNNRRIFLTNPGAVYGTPLPIGIHELSWEVYYLLKKASRLLSGGSVINSEKQWDKSRIEIQ